MTEPYQVSILTYGAILSLELENLVLILKKKMLQTFLYHVDLTGEGDFLDFSDVSLADFDRFYKKIDKWFGGDVRIMYFGASSKILLIKMVSRKYEWCGSYLVSYLLQ